MGKMILYWALVAMVVVSNAAVGQAPAARITPKAAAPEGTPRAAPQQVAPRAVAPQVMPAVAAKTPATTAGFAQTRMSAADESRLKAMIAQHQRVRSQLPAEYQIELDRLTAQVKARLFAAPLRSDLLASAAQIVSTIIPGLTTAEATSLAEYVLGGIAGSGVTGTPGGGGMGIGGATGAAGGGMGGGGAIVAAGGGSSQADLMNATKSMQETQMSFNLQYLQLQSQMQNENRSYTAVSNIMKARHDTVKNSVSNVR